ncbi:MAG: GIY-YIG nuclease family protein [Pseudomonadota bacterium]|nr:GIY-YIG nuclease family protein [Pseudomonadota bacterium]
MTKCYYVYLLTNKAYGLFYVGITDDLVRRIWEHIHGMRDGFTKKYGIHRLVHYEVFDNVQDAMNRENRLKRWNRTWKIEMIEKNNPEWNDLYNVFCEAHAVNDPRSRSLHSLGGELC